MQFRYDLIPPIVMVCFTSLAQNVRVLDIQLLYAQLNEPSTTNSAAQQIHDLALKDATAQDFMAQHLPAMISANARGDWQSINGMWLNAVRLAGQLKLVTAIPALIESLSGRNLIPVCAYDRSSCGVSTFSLAARLETDIVARALADIGDPALPAVANVLAKGETRTLRLRATWILINIDSPAARQVMRERLPAETDPGIWKLLEANSIQPKGTFPPIVLAGLNNRDWRQRADAYANLKEDQERPDVRAALLVLLDRENQVIRNTLLESDGKIPVSDKYGEGYSEYYAQLLGSVEQTVDWYDPHEVCILVQGSYNPDSQFGTTLAVRGGATAARCLLEMAQGSDNDRWEAVPVLVHLASVTKDLPLDVQQQIREATTAALQISDLRLITIAALGKFGDSDVIPVLQDIARSDQYSRVLADGTRRYDIREAAAKAIRSIQERMRVK
jgi:HEAT repeat protein